MIIPIPVMGYFPDNCYLWADEKTQHGFLIDPRAEADRLHFTLYEEGITLDGIILTHGHFDSVGTVNQLRTLHNVLIYAYEGADKLLSNPAMKWFCWQPPISRWTRSSSS